MPQVRRCALACGLVFAFGSVASAVVIPTVVIGVPGNPTDPATGNQFGSVAYTYHLGQTEVTNAQYAAFLNAVAVTDDNGLYNSNMGVAAQRGGIARFGAPGSYSYTPAPGREQWPVNWVSFWDTLRFANWLHNGQPIGNQGPGTTENGAYTLSPAGIAANSVARNANWMWAVTSEDEWYKAAYYQPTSAGGPASGYWTYPTSSNSISTAAANYNGAVGTFTPVASYAANYWGAHDLAGNVWEWNEATFPGSAVGRGLLGGSFLSANFTLAPGFRGPNDSSFGWYDYGFRVVAVPGPGLAGLAALAALALGRRRR